ncbi:MAG: DUF456 domain-containing protein [Gemmatimonadaceae bacterium]
MAILILAIILLLSVFIIPLGLPGTWVMIAAGVGYSLLLPDSIGMVALVGTLLIAVVAEVLEFTLSASYARKYGGSKRAGWGAIIGGIVGAIVGVPIPLVGPIVGAFVGSFLGAMAAEFSRGTGPAAATRVATGALIGRAVAAAMKVAAGLVIAVWLLWAAVF